MKLQQALKNIPEIIAVEVTNRCNLNCIYCNKRQQNIKDIDISPEVLGLIKSNLENIKKIIICGIGESFLYPGLYDLIHDFRKQKFCIVTNGTIPIDYERLNQHHNVEQIVFSIDALDLKVLKLISGTYRFENVLKNLTDYQKYHHRANSRITLVLNCTLNEYNLNQIYPLIDFAYQYRFDTIHFSLPRGKETFIKEHKEELKTTLTAARKLASQYGIYFADPFDVCCVYLRWVTPYITMQGDIFACAEDLYINNRLGNLKDISLKKAWKTHTYQAFQQGEHCNQCKFLSNSHMKFEMIAEG